MAIFGSLFGKKKNLWDQPDPFIMQQPGQTGIRLPVNAGASTTVQPNPLSYLDGGKMGWKDGLALALAGVGDAFTREGGGSGDMMQSMIGRNLSQADALKQRQEAVAAAQAEQAQAMQDFIGIGYSPEKAAAMAHGNIKPSDLKPEMFNNRAGDRMAVGADGKPQEIYRDNSPVFQTTQDSVYAMDPHTGGNFQQQPQGGIVHAQTPDDIANLPDGSSFIAPDGSLRVKRGGGVGNGTSGFRRPY
jgi:hypothetical protein